MRYLLLLVALITSNAFAAPNFEETMAAAKQGDADAQSRMGYAYAVGDGVLQDQSKALKWFKKAAKQGDTYAKFNLGIAFMRGLGTPKDLRTSYGWFLAAAVDGHPEAQSNLGVFYFQGMGIPENDVKAYVWLSMARTQGFTDASKNLVIIKSDMTKQQIAEAQALAAQCYESDYKDCD
jgi:TPR repeat protein